MAGTDNCGSIFEYLWAQIINILINWILHCQLRFLLMVSLLPVLISIPKNIFIQDKLDSCFRAINMFCYCLCCFFVSLQFYLCLHVHGAFLIGVFGVLIRIFTGIKWAYTKSGLFRPIKYWLWKLHIFGAL